MVVGPDLATPEHSATWAAAISKLEEEKVLDGPMSGAVAEGLALREA